MSAFAPCIVDTNVPLVANGENPAAGQACQKASITALQNILNRGAVVLDKGREILSEYSNKLRARDGQSPGDAFYLWVLQNLWTEERCHWVRITPVDDSLGGFKEFPKDPDLRKFDRSDRKFVAAALAHKDKPEILVSYDTDWWNHREALERCGVTVNFVCRSAIREASERKHKGRNRGRPKGCR